MLIRRAKEEWGRLKRTGKRARERERERKGTKKKERATINIEFIKSKEEGGKRPVNKEHISGT